MKFKSHHLQQQKVDEFKRHTKGKPSIPNWFTFEILLNKESVIGSIGSWIIPKEASMSRTWGLIYQKYGDCTMIAWWVWWHPFFQHGWPLTMHIFAIFNELCSEMYGTWWRNTFCQPQMTTTEWSDSSVGRSPTLILWLDRSIYGNLSGNVREPYLYLYPCDRAGS